MVFLFHQNAELEKVVREILDGADLEQVTMKSVCKQVRLVNSDFLLVFDI